MYSVAAPSRQLRVPPGSGSTSWSGSRPGVSRTDSSLSHQNSRGVSMLPVATNSEAGTCVLTKNRECLLEVVHVPVVESDDDRPRGKWIAGLVAHEVEQGQRLGDPTERLHLGGEVARGHAQAPRVDVGLRYAVVHEDDGPRLGSHGRPQMTGLRSRAVTTTGKRPSR